MIFILRILIFLYSNKLTPVTNESTKAAANAFCEEDDAGGYKTADFRHSPKAEAKYGPVALWDVSEMNRHIWAPCSRTARASTSTSRPGMYGKPRT